MERTLVNPLAGASVVPVPHFSWASACSAWSWLWLGESRHSQAVSLNTAFRTPGLSVMSFLVIIIAVIIYLPTHSTLYPARKNQQYLAWLSFLH